MRSSALSRRLFLAQAALVLAVSCRADGLHVLVTEAEAEASRAAPPPPLTRGFVPPGAPRIEFVSPTADGANRAPLTFELRFAPQADARIDPASLRVQYGCLRVDITDRLRAYGRVDETGAVASNLAIPRGDHRVRVLITDSRGSFDEAEYNRQLGR